MLRFPVGESCHDETEGVAGKETEGVGEGVGIEIDGGGEGGDGLLEDGRDWKDWVRGDVTMCCCVMCSVTCGIVTSAIVTCATCIVPRAVVLLCYCGAIVLCGTASCTNVPLATAPCAIVGVG